MYLMKLSEIHLKITSQPQQQAFASQALTACIKELLLLAVLLFQNDIYNEVNVK